MTSLDIAEILAEVRALRQEILEIKIAMARQDGENLSSQVQDLNKRITRLELWRAGLIAASTASVASAVAALLKVFGVN